MSDPVKTESASVSLIEEFRTEFAAVWRLLPNKDLFFILLAAWFALFHFLGNATLGYIPTASLFDWMRAVYNVKDSEDGHGPLVPFVVLILTWLKRKELVALSLRAWWPGLFILLLSLVLHVLGYMVQQPRVSIVAFILGLWGLMGLAWGPDFLRHSAFPYWFMVFMIPVATFSPVEGFTFHLRMLVAKISVFLTASVLGLDVIRDGSQIFNSTKSLQFDVAPACSGIRSLAATFFLATIVAALCKTSRWKQLLIVCSAVPFAILGNVLRLMTIILAGSLWGQSAGEYVHESSWFSLLPYVPAMIGLILMAQWLGQPKTSAQAAPNPE